MCPCQHPAPFPGEFQKHKPSSSEVASAEGVQFCAAELAEIAKEVDRPLWAMSRNSWKVLSGCKYVSMIVRAIRSALAMTFGDDSTRILARSASMRRRLEVENLFFGISSMLP
jgi:hypothetical protein